MKLTALIENTSADERLTPEFGLSLFVQANGRNVLFDAGQSGRAFENAQVIGLDVEAVDFAVLSHGHYDHADGFPTFLRVNQHAPIYVHAGFDGNHIGSAGNYIGVTRELAKSSRVVPVQGHLDAAPGFAIEDFQDQGLQVALQPCGMTVERDGVRTPEEFLHEHYLLVTEGRTKVLITGCSHRGILNIATWAADAGVTHVVGGFHLMGMKEERLAEVDDVARKLLAYPIDYVTCHCTGLPQYERCKAVMGNRLRYLATGQSIEVR